MVSFSRMGRKDSVLSGNIYLLCAFLLLFFSSTVTGHSSDDRNVLLEIKNSFSDEYGILKSWSPDRFDHCSWFGISCNSNFRVSGLRIVGNLSSSPSCSLKSKLSLHWYGIIRNCSEINGKLAGNLSPVIGNLTELRFLSLPYNNLYGEIPVGTWRLKNLEVLDLEGNLFIGNFSSYEFSYLGRLRVLNLAFNRIFGKFPVSISKCRGLRVLNLAGNKMNDVSPDYLGSWRKLKFINLSFLVGYVPNTSGYDCGNLGHPSHLSVGYVKKEVPLAFRNCSHFNKLWLSSTGVLHYHIGMSQSLKVFDVSKYAETPYPGNRTDKSKPHQVPSESNPNSKSRFDHQIPVLVLASVIIVSIIISILLVLLTCFCCSRRRSGPQVSEIESPPTHQENKVTIFNNIGIPITYDSIVQATRNFSQNYCIGRGGFGCTYRAEISSNQIVAVKRRTAEQGDPQFHAEVSILGRIKHPNLVTLIGCFSSQQEMFLIYNYLSGGNLLQFIKERERRVFDWNIVHKISLHIASAILYLHEERILHRDIKPSNILLDENNNAYLADFGLSRILSSMESHETTRVAGTYGYIAPEYAMTSRVSEKSDVYSYGVVLMELMSDKQVLDPSFDLREAGFNIVSWARLLLHEGSEEDFFVDSLWDSGPRDKLRELLFVAVACTVEVASARVKMRQVVRRLKQLQSPVA